VRAKLVLGLAGLALLLGAFALVPLVAHGDAGGELSAYQGGTQGLSDARAAAANAGFVVRNVASSPLVVRDVNASRSVLVVAGLDKPYTDNEAKALDRYMTAGGSILLLDDYGYGEQFALRHGIGSLKRPLLDKSFDRNQSFVKVAALFDDGTVYNLLLDAPSGLQDTDANDTALHPFMVSSADSYLDLQPNGLIDVIDKIGPFNVGVRAQVGAGALYVIADSGFVDNDMLGRADNAKFLTGLLKYRLGDPATTSPPGLVLFDESKKPVSGAELSVLSTERGLLALFRSLPVNGLLFLAALAVVALALLVRLPGRVSWVHRFLPRRFVPPAAPPSERAMLTSILESKRALDLGSGEEADPVLREAMRDPSRVRDADVPLVLKKVRDALDLEFPDDSPLEV
jgi:hypothetical protein